MKILRYKTSKRMRTKKYKAWKKFKDGRNFYWVYKHEEWT